MAFFVPVLGAWNLESLSNTSCRPAFSTTLFLLLFPWSPGSSTSAGSPTPAPDQDQAVAFILFLFLTLTPTAHDTFDPGLWTVEDNLRIQVAKSDIAESIIPGGSHLKLSHLQGRLSFRSYAFFCSIIEDWL